MCPACLTSLGLIAAKTGFSGGLAVVVARGLRRIASGKEEAAIEPTDAPPNDGASPSEALVKMEDRTVVQ